MLGAIASSLPVAVGLLLAALPVVILSLVLASKRPVAVSYAFVGGWCVGLFLVGAIIIALADVVDLAGGTSTWTSVLKLVAGIVLIVLAVHKWITRPRGDQELTIPGWMAAADRLTSGQALVLGFLLAAANPKNLVLVVAGGTVIAEATAQVSAQAVALLVFVVVASLAVAAPSLIRRALGTRSEPLLAAADSWMTRQSSTIMSVVLLVLGAVLALNAFGALRSGTSAL